MEYKNDSELLYLIKEENEDAKEIFYEKYKSTIEVIAKKYLSLAKNSGIEINDLIQEGMLGLTTAIETYNSQKKVKFKTFANICIERSIISYIRKNTSLKNQTLNLSISMDTTLNSNGKSLLELIKDNKNLNPEDIYITSEMNKEIMNKIKKVLTERENDVFVLRMRGFSYNEISILLNITEKSVERSISRAKSKLEKIVKNID